MDENDDLDDFLLGNSTEKSDATENSAKKEKSAEQDGATPSPSKEVEPNDSVEDEEEESSEDDLEIVLDGDVGASAADSKLQLKPTSQKAVLDDTIEEEVEEVVPLRQSININAIGQYQNQKILEFDINNVAEQPWRRPGADITDYFNYGFNENTWKDYCMKQRELREAFPYGGAVYQQNIQKKSVFDKAMDEMGVPVSGQYEAAQPAQKPESNDQDYDQQSLTETSYSSSYRRQDKRTFVEDRSEYSHRSNKRRRDRSIDSVGSSGARGYRGDDGRRHYQSRRNDDYRSKHGGRGHGRRSRR